MTETVEKKTIKALNPSDKVKSCKWLETGCCVQLGGIYCCVHGSISSPIIVSTDEIKEGKATYDLIVQRKRELFEGLNGLRDDIDVGSCATCSNVIEREYKDVHFDKIGGYPLPAGFNIQHYTQCNERCLYCCYAQENNFKAPEYNMLDIFEEFNKRGKLGKNAWIDFSGGEPAMLKNFEEIIQYMMKNEMGTVVVYSNASLFSPSIKNYLKDNRIILTTSLDTGIKSTYGHLRGVDVFEKVIDNLIKYRNSGTDNLWLKYVITEHNRTDDDMWSFLLAMMALRPNRVFICPDFPYGDKQIPDETVKFAAKLWYLIEKYLGEIAADYTSAMGDPKFTIYHEKLAAEIKALKEKSPITPDMRLITYNQIVTPTHCCECKENKVNFIQTIFSIKNEGKHKVVRVLGIKIKLKRKVK